MDNNIRVPENFRKQLKVRSSQDPEYRIACIRDLIIERAGKPITVKDFSIAAYGHPNNAAYASKIVKRLIKSGRITRVRDTKNLKRRIYTWHNPRLIGDKPRNGPVVVKPISPFKPTTPRSFTAEVEDMSKFAELAKDFAWDHNSDSLREFMGYVLKKDLNNRTERDSGEV